MSIQLEWLSSQNNKTTVTGEHVGKKDNIKLLGGGWEYKLVKALWKIIQRFLKNLWIDLPYDSAIVPLGMCQRGMN